MLEEGTTLIAPRKHLKVTEQTYNRWRNPYGGDEVRRRQAVDGGGEGEGPSGADDRRQALDIDMPKEVNQEGFCARGAVNHLIGASDYRV